MEIVVSRYNKQKGEVENEIKRVVHKSDKIAATIAANRIAHVNHSEVWEKCLGLKVGESFVITVSTTRGSYHYERTV